MAEIFYEDAVLLYRRGYYADALDKDMEAMRYNSKHDNAFKLYRKLISVARIIPNSNAENDAKKSRLLLTGINAFIEIYILSGLTLILILLTFIKIFR
ncbi:MAG: hypothetical protein HY919_08525 [Elusimicrobia bacterium]|nr:hypothetical protein [Elusimicrobiota bacterium]